MATPERKTRPTTASVKKFLNSIDDDVKGEDSRAIDRLMQVATGESPVMWGESIVGYGMQPIRYASGAALDWPRIAFAPRKQNLTLYVMGGGEEAYKDLSEKLGKHSISKSCLYIKRLSDVDVSVLKEWIRRAYATEL